MLLDEPGITRALVVASIDTLAEAPEELFPLVLDLLTVGSHVCIIEQRRHLALVDAAVVAVVVRPDKRPPTRPDVPGSRITSGTIVPPPQEMMTSPSPPHPWNPRGYSRCRPLSNATLAPPRTACNYLR